MEQIEDQTIVVEKDGKEVELDLLFTFDSEETGKVYMAYTDYSKNEHGYDNIYVYSFDPILGRVESVSDQAEIDMTNSVIEEVRREMLK